MVSFTSTPPNVILSNEPVLTVNLLETFIYELAVTSFLNLRVVLENDSSANWEELLETKGKIKPDIDENEFSENDNNELKEFTLGN